MSIVLFAQDDRLSQAKILFSNGKYSASQFILDQLINPEDITAESMYLSAKCSKELFLSDAISLYNSLDEIFPYHDFKDEVNIDLSLIYYRQKEYKNAISFFSKVKSLSNEQLFKLAYSYFSINELEEARLCFAKIMHADSKFASASQYYYASIAYERGLYKSALKSFEKLLRDEKFGSIVPYYICHIYFFQKEYKKLIAFGKPLCDDVIESRKSEINRLLAEAYYRTNDFPNAAYHFEQFAVNQAVLNPMAYYLLGYSYFKSKAYEDAVFNFEKVTNASDSVMQYSSYYLGVSYLKLGYYNYALQAFKSSSSYDYNKILQEDAYYNYAKLSYQLDLPFDNTLKTLTYYLEAFNHPLHTKRINTLLAKTFESTTQYDKAYMLLKDISRPNIDQRKILQQLSFFLGVKEFNQKNFNAAIEYFSYSNKYPVSETYSYLSDFWIADSYFQLGDYRKSIASYNALSISADEKLSDYENLKKYNLAYSYFQIQDYLNAVKWFRSYEKLGSDSIKINDTYLRIADGYFMLSDFSLAAKYYEKVVDLNLFDVDYALYQGSVSLGLIGRDLLKVNLLKRIIDDFPYSSYYDNAIYDLARYYKNILDFKMANKYYDTLISISSDDNLLADAFLSKGMIYFNRGKVEFAIKEFLSVINEYQQTKYFKEALSGLQLAYSSTAEIEEYLSIIESLPEISITKAEQDSLTYNAAFLKFSEMDYKVAKNAFDKYLEIFDNGIFRDDALYYNAISSLKILDTTSAVLNYEQLILDVNSAYQEEALIFLSRRSHNTGDLQNSNMYYSKLLEVVSSNSIKREVVVRLMQGNESFDKTLAIKYAKQVVEFEKIDNWLLSRAYLIIAKDEFESGNYAKSKSTFELVSQLSLYDEGAEAKYYLAYLTYLDEDLVFAEQLIFTLVENYSNDHFIAKAFILLSDIYMAQNNIFQAKATLESIIENHKGEDVINSARKKMEVILEINKEMIIEEVNEQSFIDISEDDLQYELCEVDEDYVVPSLDGGKAEKDSVRLTNDYRR